MLIFSEVLTMKHTFRTLLGLVLVVFVLAGCSNPAGPETPEVNEPPVVEVPEDNARLVKVEFRWGTNHIVNWEDKNMFTFYSPIYLLDLHFDSELNGYVYDLPEGYILNSYREFWKDEKDTEVFEQFLDNIFKETFGTKYYKEGTVIDLTKWTYKAKELLSNKWVSCLHFSTIDLEVFDAKDTFNEVIVGDEDIVIYVFWDFDRAQQPK